MWPSPVYEVMVSRIGENVHIYLRGLSMNSVVGQEGASPTGLILALILVQWAKLPAG